MSTEPPPFGDPTRVDQENSAAVRRGILFGCGGCAGLGVLAAVLGLSILAVILFIVFSALRNSDACQDSFRTAQASEVMKRELGEPMELGWVVSGSISINNGHGNAEVNVPISGPAGEATVHTVATKESGGPWIYSKMEATISKTGEKVNLR